MLPPVLAYAFVAHSHMCFSFLSPPPPPFLIFEVVSCYVDHTGLKFSIPLLFLLTSQPLSL